MGVSSGDDLTVLLPDDGRRGDAVRPARQDHLPVLYDGELGLLVLDDGRL